jgi:hypothetical protein
MPDVNLTEPSLEKLFAEALAMIRESGESPEDQATAAGLVAFALLARSGATTQPRSDEQKDRT